MYKSRENKNFISPQFYVSLKKKFIRFKVWQQKIINQLLVLSFILVQFSTGIGLHNSSFSKSTSNLFNKKSNETKQTKKLIIMDSFDFIKKNLLSGKK